MRNVLFFIIKIKVGLYASLGNHWFSYACGAKMLMAFHLAKRKVDTCITLACLIGNEKEQSSYPALFAVRK